MRFLIRLLINAAALWIATRLVPGITASPDPVTFLTVALVFGLLNALVGPLLRVLTCPLMILTLGLFTFVINALILLLTSSLAGRFGLGFHVAGFWSAFWGALVVSIVSVLLSIFVREPDPHRD
ncbi:MAG TPA: phage holin family protein [Thermoanaerobaculia bacterium]|nr:phage holin family protein [Thermoanaerobaculia bacterium]